MGWKTWLRRGLGIALMGAVLFPAGCSQAPPPDEPRVAPLFRLQAVDGSEVALDELNGKVVLLDFWATWCPPCRAALPHLVDLQQRYRSDGLAVLGMNMDYDEDDLREFLDGESINYPTLRLDDDTRLAYGGVASIPQHFLIDRKGRIRKKFMGYDANVAAEMEEIIQALLREEGPEAAK